MNSVDNEYLIRPSWWLPVGALVLLLVITLFSLGFLGGEDRVEPGRRDDTVETLPANANIYKVSAVVSTNSLSWQGIVKSKMTTRVAAKVAARVLEVGVRPGDGVKKGDVIVRLDDRELRAAQNAASSALEVAQVQAAQADTEEKRISGLYQKEAATRQNYDAVIAQARSARAIVGQAASALQQAKVALGESVLYAPFDGVVGERFKEPGDLVVPGEPIVTIHKSNELRFEAAIASQCGTDLKVGDTVVVNIEAIHRQVLGRIGEILPDIDPSTHSRLVKVDLPAIDDARQGHFGWLSLACQQAKSSLSIPVSTLLRYGQLEAVRVWDGRSIHTRHIRTGKRDGDKVAVLSGLREGESVIDLGGLRQ